jgi:hypothetical protein
MSCHNFHHSHYADGLNPSAKLDAKDVDVLLSIAKEPNQ